MRLNSFRPLGLWFGGLVLAWLAAPGVGAEENAQREIERAYLRCSAAVGLKFVDGMQSIRAPGFQLFDTDGEKIDLNVDRLRNERFLRSIISVEDRTEVTSFKQSDASHATCNAHSTTYCVAVDASTKKEVTMLLETDSRDEWVRTADGWRQKSCRVMKQTYKRAETRPKGSK